MTGNDPDTLLSTYAAPFDASIYTLFWADGQNYDTSGSGCSGFVFKFYLPNIADVSRLAGYAIAKQPGTHAGMELRIWKEASSTWELLASSSVNSGALEPMRGEVSSGISDYSRSGWISLLVCEADDSNGSISIDYVALDVTGIPKGDSEPPPGDWENVLTLNYDYALDQYFQTYFVDASGGARTMTVPNAAQWKNRTFTVKKTDSSGNSVTLDATVAGTPIDAALTFAISLQWESASIRSDGTQWFIV